MRVSRHLVPAGGGSLSETRQAAEFRVKSSSWYRSSMA